MTARWLVLAVVVAAPARPSAAQVLLHRYSFNGDASDSVGTANGTVVGNVTFQSDPNAVNGAAVFGGGTSSSAPGYIRLPVSAVSSLQNATIEIFTTRFDMPSDQYGQPNGQFQALFGAGTSYGNQTNYAILSPNRGGAGIGIGARSNNATETVITSTDPLPVWQQNHVVHLVFSGYGVVGAAGYQTIYLDGNQVARGVSRFTFAFVATGTGGITTVGIGGGSPFNDPTFRGSMSEVRIYDGALTLSQIRADVDAGPSSLGFTPPYTVAEAARAMAIASGIGPGPTPWERTRLDVETVGPSSGVIDFADALRIARKAMGTDPL